MSITIYYGLRAVASDPFEVARQVRSVLEPVFHEKFKQANDRAEANVGALWSDIFRGGQKTEIPHEYRVSSDLYRIVEKLHYQSEHTFSELDFAYDVSLYQNAAGGNPLVLVFGENTREYHSLLLESGVVTDYGYWNNTDEQEGVSREDWELREKAWSNFTDPNLVSSELKISIPDVLETTVKLLPPLIF